MSIQTDNLTETTEELAIGTNEGFGILFVGESLDFELTWKHFDVVTCRHIATDFTGFTAIAEIRDAAGLVIQVVTVTPSAGDPTGKFLYHVDPADITASLRTNAKKWVFRITAGSTVNHFLIHTTATVT